MPDEPVALPTQAPEPKDDPFDLGETGLDFQQPRDPDTGRFLPPSPEPTTPATPAPLPPKHPSYLVERARLLGIPADEIEDYSTAQLDRVCWRLAQQQLDFRAQQDTARLLTNPRAPSVSPGAPPSPAPTPVEEDIDLGLSEADYDPALVAAMKKIAATGTKRIKDLEGQLAERDQRDTARQLKSNEELIDAAFAKLGKDYEKFFGKGAARSFGDDKKKELKRRLLCLTDAGVDVNNVDRHTIVAKLKEAADAWLPPVEAPAPAPNAYAKPNGRIAAEDWQAAAVAHPSARRGAPEPKGEALATKNLEARMRDEGMLADGGKEDLEIMDGLLPD